MLLMGVKLKKDALVEQGFDVVVLESTEETSLYGLSDRIYCSLITCVAQGRNRQLQFMQCLYIEKQRNES